MAFRATSSKYPGTPHSEAAWTAGAGVGQPFSYSCPPTVDLPPPPLIPPSSWAAFVSSRLADEVKALVEPAIEQAIPQWWATLQGYELQHPEYQPCRLSIAFVL
jgi:hypothetical protein